MIIAGERRFRASKLAGLTKIPAYIKRVSDETMMEMALVENIQREDLNAIEIALTYQRLLDEYKFTQEKLSERVGKKRATVANYLRLLKLPAEIQLGLTKKEIDMGHARALINVQDPTKMIKLYEEVVAKGYSVRKVEELVRQLNEEGGVSSQGKKPADPELQKAYSQIADRLSNIFGAKVKVDRNEKGKGKISLVFSSDEELENILMVIDSLKN
jgi:ParB family chromosome partitioning protein